MGTPNLEHPKGIIEWFHEAEGRRANTENTWEQIAQHGLGSREFTSKQDPGRNRFNKIYDTTFQQSAQLLSGALHGMMASPGAQWFHLRPEDDYLIDDLEVRVWLEMVEEVMLRNLQRAESGWTSTVAEAFTDIAAFGNCCYWTEDTSGRGATFSSRALSEIWIVTNAQGKTIAFFRRFELPVWKIVDIWGRATEKIDRMMDKEPMKELELLQLVHKTDTVLHDQPFRRPWRSIVLDLMNEELLSGSEEGFFENPLVYARWTKETYEDYGRGPGWIALSDARMLNEMQKTFLKAAQKAADPPLIVFDDGQLLQIRTGPGGLNVFQGLPGDGAPLQPLPSGADHRITDTIIRQKQESIKAAFHAQLLQLFEDPKMTATQVIELSNQAQRLMAPMIGRLETEQLEPTLERVYQINSRQGNFPDVPPILQGKRIRIDYVSPISKSQKVSEARGIVELWQNAAILAQAGAPDALDLLNGDESLKNIHAALGAPMNVLRDPQEVADKRAAQAQMAQEQQMLNQAQQGGQALESITNAVEQGGIPTE